MVAEPLPADETSEVLDREIREVATAIALVSQGRAIRIAVCNLTDPETAVAALSWLSRTAQVAVELAPRAAGPGLDVVVRGR